MYRPVLVTPPTKTPIDKSDVKALLGITTTDKDDLIDGYIAGAVSMIDGWSGTLGRCLCEQTWRQEFDCFARVLRLPLFPVISITSVKYDDAEGVEQTVAGGAYARLNDSLGAYVQFADTFATPNLQSKTGPRVRVEYTAGYAEVDAKQTVPDAIKVALKMMVSDMVRLGERSPYLSQERIDGVIEKRYTVSKDSFSPSQQAIEALLAPWRRVGL